MKNLPTLPDNIAKEYEALVVPTTIIIQKPKRKVIDMTRLTKEQAEELAEKGKYVVRKSNKPASVPSELKKQ